MRRQQKYHEPKCGSGFATLKEISMTVEKLHLNYSIACLTKKWKKLNPSLAKKSFLKGLMKQQQKFLTISSRAILLKRSEEHTSELQSRFDLVCRLLLEKKKKISRMKIY